MILAINIGNTNVSCTVYSEKIIEVFRYPIDDNFLIDKLAKKLRVLKLLGVIIASVVPSFTPSLVEFFQTKLELIPYVVNKSFPFSLDFSNYDSSLVGIDRLLVCEIALMKYRAPLVVFDFGTATTVNVVNKENQFLGGMIIVGMEIGLKALASKTALLPEGTLNHEKIPLIGRNTDECLRAGAIYSNVALVEDISKKIAEELESEVTIVITGGNAASLFPFLKSEAIYEPSLLLEGLIMMYERVNKS